MILRQLLFRVKSSIVVFILCTLNISFFGIALSSNATLEDHVLSNNPNIGQLVTDIIRGPTEPDQVAVPNIPPDTMGAVGPAQFMFVLNGHFQAVNKTVPHTVVLDTADTTFWGISPNIGAFDTRVYYDRASQRWFITELDMKPADNNVYLAISSGPDLSTATWHKTSIPLTGATYPQQDNGCVGDYDTLGIDQNAIYIGAVIATNGYPSGNCSGEAIVHSNLYVIPKLPALNGTVNFTPFYNISNGVNGPGPFAPMGVDSYDVLPTGYVIGRNENGPFITANRLLAVILVNNPASSSPSLSSPILIYIPSENSTLGNDSGGILTPNNTTRPMDDGDDRLLAAVIRNGHLWVSHDLAVNQAGGSNPLNADRDAVRWYDINVSALTLNQFGTVFDNAVSNPMNYWTGTLMASGQGHIVMGMNAANINIPPRAEVVSRLANDAPSTMSRLNAVYQSSTSDLYDDSVSPFFNPSPNRWGDYSYTSLDPCDDMTIWTVQEYVAGSTGEVDWGVSAAKIQAPSPAVLPGSSVATIATGKSNVSLSLSGTAPNGEGFYDTPSSADASCRTRLSATVTNGVSVSNVTYVDPLHVNLTLNTVGASAGTATVTITNPDGQTSTTYITLVTPSGPAIDTIGVFRSGTFLLRLHNSTGNADITATFNPATKPYPVVGDWTGAGFDTIGVLNQNNGLFSLCTANDTTTCANSGNVIQLVLGNANDMPLAGRWTAGAAHAGAGVFRPSNGLIYFKNSLTTGYADYQMVLGIPGDVGLAGDWNGDSVDSPGVYRPSNSTFYLTDTVCNCTPTANYQFQYGVGGDAPVIGDWIAQGHDGVGLFRQSNGFTYLKNALTTGIADDPFTYGIAGDVPVAGHWQLTYPNEPPPISAQVPPILVPRTPIPYPTAQPAETGGLQD